MLNSRLIQTWGLPLPHTRPHPSRGDFIQTLLYCFTIFLLLHCSELLKVPCLRPPFFCLALLRFISAACSQRFWLICMTVTGIIIGFEFSIFRLLCTWKLAGVSSKSPRKVRDGMEGWIRKSEKSGAGRRAQCAPFNLKPDTTVCTKTRFSIDNFINSFEFSLCW